MSAKCLKCGVHLEADLTFCPHCAMPFWQKVEPTPRKHESAPVKGGLSGLLLGVTAAPVLIIAGGLICLTGLGAFLGVPMVLAGVCTPLIGSLLGMSASDGKCPWCGAKVGSVAPIDHFSCPECGKRIELRKEEMLRAE